MSATVDLECESCQWIEADVELEDFDVLGFMDCPMCDGGNLEVCTG
ncbi:MAG: hypothetical protein LC808_23890 [Actinobacteria bacterium]|nr:hypothetical protein [Actinomycetota bacterium]